MRELESGDPVGNILAENADNNAQLLDVAVDENIGNQANNNDHGDVSDVMEQVLDTAAVENIVGYQNNHPGDVMADFEFIDFQSNDNENVDNHHDVADDDPQEPVQVPSDITGFTLP